MTKTTKPIPDGYHTVTPYLCVADAERLLAFLKQAFGGEETFRMSAPNGRVRHAEARVGDSMLMIGQPDDPAARNKTMLYLYVPDCDAMFAQATAAGAKVVQPPTDHDYGDRSGAVEDAEGNQWWIATHLGEKSTSSKE